MKRIDYRWALLAILLMSQSAWASEDLPRIDPAGIPGALVISGSSIPDDAIEQFLNRSNGDRSRVLVLVTENDERSAEISARLLSAWRDKNGVSFQVIRLPDESSITGDVLSAIDQATGTWVIGESEDATHPIFTSDDGRRAIGRLLRRDGVVALETDLAWRLSGYLDPAISGTTSSEETFRLFPDVVIAEQPSELDAESNVESVLRENPALVGIEIAENAALIVNRRHIHAIGDGQIRAILAGTGNKHAQEFIMVDSNSTLDLVGLRRAGRDRIGPKFPPDTPATPFVENGTLIIIGGGGMPSGIIDRFVDLAGGDESVIIVLPTAMPDPLPQNDRIAGAFESAGAGEVHVLTGRTLEVVESEEYIELFQRATGIWFGGGRQWRFVDAYYDTQVHELMHQTLDRGGVIMGSSAGASIQAEYMARGTPIDNRDIMADGYERGLGFLPGAAVDQHFSQRRRFNDMSSLVERYPQLLGIGIDEATALVVNHSNGAVVGRGGVHFYDASRERGADDLDYESVYDQGLYDLAKRVIVEPGNKPEAATSNQQEARPVRPPRPPVTQEERVQRFADAMMSRYDKDENGALDEQELSEVRRKPEGADEDQDGKVTRSELEIWLRKQFN